MTPTGTTKPGGLTGGCKSSLDVSLDKPIALEAGSRFAIHEGGKTVGSGVVKEVIACAIRPPVVEYCPKANRTAAPFKMSGYSFLGRRAVCEPARVTR